MYSQQSNNSTAMAPPQKPETFMLSNEAQQSLPQDAQVALQQVDNCKLIPPRQLPGLKNRRSGYCQSHIHVASANMLRSKIFPYLCTCGLDPRPVHPKIPATHWRVRILRFVVSHRIQW